MPINFDSIPRTRVLVCGSRDWRNRKSISLVLQRLPLNAVVVHGACSRKDPDTGVEMSADMIADDVAIALGLQVERHPAYWQQWSRSAGRIRNIEMLDSGVEKVIAFQRNHSSGTQHTLDEALKRGIPAEIYRA